MDAATKNGSNRFYSPTNSMWTDAGTAYLSSNNSIDFNSEPGMMIVFPSHIQHSALLYRGKRDRIVIAINSKIERVEP
jgi:hypothetical protein